jgi:hypothetical protein
MFCKLEINLNTSIRLKNHFGVPLLCLEWDSEDKRIVKCGFPDSVLELGGCPPWCFIYKSELRYAWEQIL